MKVPFSEGDDQWWFDPESGDYEYRGSNPSVDYVLSTMMEWSDVEPEISGDKISHPGETWEQVSPKERRQIILNYLSSINGIEIHERETPSN